MKILFFNVLANDTIYVVSPTPMAPPPMMEIKGWYLPKAIFRWSLTGIASNIFFIVGYFSEPLITFRGDAPGDMIKMSYLLKFRIFNFHSPSHL
jgi:hypothetical protein